MGKCLSVGIAAFAAVVALSAPATADVGDGGSAVLSTATDIAAAALANTVQDPNDNIACDVPKVGGGVVNQRTGYFVGEVYGNDLGFGELTCARIDGGAFTLRGTAYIEVYSGGHWGLARTGPTALMPSVGGVAAVAPSVTGSYAALDAALNKYHRTRVVFTTNTGRAYTMLSTPWFMSA